MSKPEPMELPQVKEVRRRIDAVPEDDVRMCLKDVYLKCGRISESIGVVSPGDTTHAYGLKGSDAQTAYFVSGPIKENVLILPVRTAKRGGFMRYAAVPLADRYEPWSRELLDYYQSRGESLVFPFTRQYVWQHSRDIFKGLTYPIERYTIKDGEIKTVVNRHLRQFRLHALRHLRASELITFFGFDGFDCSIYGGWTVRTATSVSSILSRYLQLDWQRYFIKLLKRRID